MADSNSASQLYGGCNWVLKTKTGSETYRYICSDESGSWVVCIAEEKGGVEKLKKPEGSTPTHWRRATISARLRAQVLWRVDERGIPLRMELAEIARGDDVELDLKRNVAEHLVQTYGCAELMDPKVWKRAMHGTVAKFGVTKASVAKWFGRHIFYGGHPNACMDHDWDKGGRGKKRRDLVDADGKPRVMGRPTSAERLDPNTPHKRVRVTTRMSNAWLAFIRREGWASNDGLRELLRRFKLSRVAYNRGKDGKVEVYPIDPRHFPSDDAMHKVGRPELKRVRWERDIARNSLPGYRRTTSGGSAQVLVKDGLPVFDLDGTVADFHLVFGDETIYIDGHGKPTVVIAVDRGSGAIVGWYVTFGTENGDCYKNCLFSAYTPKDRELARWKMQHLLGMVYGCASQIFVDRGPGIAENVQRAAVDRLRADALMARPGDPEGKGHIEQVMGDTQKELRCLPGSTHTTGNADEDRRRRNRVTKDVVVTLDQFMRALLTVISRRNLTMDVRHLLTLDMLKSGVRPVPAEIFAYNKGLQRGDSEWEWTEDRIFRTLCDQKPLPAPGGTVSIKKRRYTSDRLKAVARAHESGGGKTLVVNTLEIPNAPTYLLWEDLGGRLDVLEATDGTVASFGDNPTWTHDYISLMKNRGLKSGRHDARKHTTVEDAVPKSSLSRARHQRQLQAEKNSSTGVGEPLPFAKRKAAARRHEEKGHVGAVRSIVGVSGDQTPLPTKAQGTPKRGLLDFEEESLHDLIG
ncbi:hypothetical protein R8510_05181 [Ralstonia chuxiongensis]|nr:hypothetical protein R8510_05181 [Ralstonia chuxiongensis]